MEGVGRDRHKTVSFIVWCVLNVCMLTINARPQGQIQSYVLVSLME